ncbi:MAG: hypothetical protein VX519_12580 [Myxococcota bacterium]|nr:hypothetical protein [Myxococcota bacterium]
MNFLLVCIGLANAGGPTVVLATAAPPGIEALWQETARLEGTSGPAAELACRPLVEDLPLCFRVEEEGRRRWVTRADLQGWGLTVEDLERKASETLTTNPFQQRTVSGGEGQWWAVDTPAGREGTVLLHPEWLKTVGPNPVLAIPGRDTFFAWNLGDAELDKIMAVGIRKANEQSHIPVTTRILGLDGQRWVVRGDLKSANPQGMQ